MFTFFNVALEAYIHRIKCFSISSILISNSTREPNGDQSLELSSTFDPPNCMICLHTNFWHNLEPNKKNHVVSGPFRRFTKIHFRSRVVQFFPENLQGKCHHNTFTRGVNEREKHRAIWREGIFVDDTMYQLESLWDHDFLDCNCTNA